MAEAEQTIRNTAIDQTIVRIENLYRALTGRDVPPGDKLYAPIPVERDPAEHVEVQLNRLLTILGEIRPVPAEVRSWMPCMSVYESEAEVLVCMDLPGVKREQVEVSAQGNVITVAGNRWAAQENGFRLDMTEAPRGRFSRSIAVPGVALPQEVNARMRDGVLEIRIPRPEEARKGPRTVAVN